MSMNVCLSCTVLTALLCSVLAAPAEHKITSLPGLTSKINFDQYAGYVNVDADSNKNIFYWFVESQSDPANDPVVLWTNGGPGSSSMTGFLTEHGPFRVVNGGNLALYNWSWNRVASLLYIEDPVGVGFSYSDDPADYVTGDAQTAADNYQFLLGWLELFPEYAKNPLYLSGESYAGHYIPTLAQYIIRHDTAQRVNVAGLLIGNPATQTDYFVRQVDPKQNAWNFLQMVSARALIPQWAYAAAVRACGWSEIMFPESCVNEANWTSPSEDCLDAIRICMEYYPVGDVDVYGLPYPVCRAPGAASPSTLSYTSQWNSMSALLANMPVRKSEASPLTMNSIQQGTGDFDPCLGNYMGQFLNRPEVQKAIHVRPTNWESMSTVLNYSDSDMHADMLPVYQDILRSTARTQSWRILIFSGDADGCVPHFGTQRWVECLDRPVQSGWRTWHLNNQVAGAIVQYDRISFATIKDAGHMVPYYKPEAGFTFFARWITKTPL